MTIITAVFIITFLLPIFHLLANGKLKAFQKWIKLI